MEDNKIDNKVEEQLKSIREHEKNNEILFITINGVSVAKIEDIIKQPIDGLLYDLNRDMATLSTIAKSSKSMRWVNDIALVNVLKYVMMQNTALIEENAELKNEHNKFKEEYDKLKLEYGMFAKDPFDSKYKYDTTPIPTASKPSIEKNNQNAGKIMPGFNDQLNIAL